MNKKYQIIYADPSWSYSISSSIAGGRGQNTKYRCLRPVEIYDLPVEKIADENCVLFLWVTYPFLQKSFVADAPAPFLFLKIKKDVPTVPPSVTEIVTLSPA
ncbi:hypothetical protein LCGC14_2090880, partial [marine sediment metagenome]